MMMFLNAIVICVVVGFLCLMAYFVSVLVLMCFGVVRKWKLALLSIPCTVLLLVGWMLYQSRPAAVFEQSFGFARPADVAGLQSSHFALGDSGQTYLRFKASKTTIDRILARGLSPVTSATPSFSTTAQPPDWWTPPSTTTEYRGEFHQAFSIETETLYLDAATGEVFFRFVGVD